MERFSWAQGVGAIMALAATMMGGSAHAVGALADIQIYDRVEGRQLPVYQHEGRYYVVGHPGHEYQIVLRNNAAGRVLAVTSVDGVNAITGDSASPAQSGYVLDGYGSLEIKGWRKSMSRTAAFYFTSIENSYAARTGRPWDVGVIGVALFRERAPLPPEPPSVYRDGARQDAPASAAAAPRAMEKSLGTGHGRSEWSSARYTDFVRASSEPDEMLAIYYDSRANLVARGVIPEYPHYAQPNPNPFPQRFVPDPR
jgi:hypothetical protein